MLVIAKDHESNVPQLTQSADFFAKLIQAFPGVHSVRWRVKDVEHLLEKIIRKRAEGQAKYDEINERNYFTIVTDLIGVRALHLFKDDCFAIDSLLRNNWDPIENPIVYTRAGDDETFSQRLLDLGFELKCHPAGYRSVHYVFASQPLARKVMMEVQVRTIFEEGWSEIDHKVRYPNFSENKLIGYLLTIFNRMAGSADEMAGFVRGLAVAVDGFEGKLATATAEKEASFAAMEKVLEELNNVKQQDRESKNNLIKLNAELEKMKKNSIAELTPNNDMWKVLSDTIVMLAKEKNEKRSGNKFILTTSSRHDGANKG